MTVRVLDPIEHIRKYPGMYIGSTYNPQHLLQEVLDNALDEVINGYADEINVQIENNEIIVTDNGRGIPIHPVEVNGKRLDSVIAICTVLLSGSKFDRTDYNFSIGMHGIGLVAVNALSTELEIFVNKDQHVYHYLFTNSELKNKDIYQAKGDLNWTTYVRFRPDERYFETLEIDLARVFDQLLLVKYLFPNTKIFLNDQPVKEISKQEYIDYIFNENSKDSYIDLNYSTNGFSIYLALKYSENGAFHSYINLKQAEGRHESTIRNIFYKVLTEYGLTSITRSDINNHLKILAILFLDNPHFDSQSKNYLISNIGIYLKDEFINLLKKQLKNSQILESFRQLDNEKKKRQLSKKVKRAKRTTAGNPIVDSRIIPGDTLYIVEGESAGGTVQEILDNKHEGLLPITGKILNVVKSNIEKVVDSKKMKYLLEAIGINPVDPSKSSFRYKNIKILADADPDGYHIVVLCLVTLLKFAPELIYEQAVSVILPPLYGTTIKGKFIPIYKKEDISKYKNVKRFKGLGQMNPEELEVILRGQGYEYIVTYPSKDEQKALYNILALAPVKRELCKKPIYLRDLFDNFH